MHICCRWSNGSKPILFLLLMAVLASVLGATANAGMLAERLNQSPREQKPAIMLDLAMALRRTQPEQSLDWAIRAEILAEELAQDYILGMARKEKGNYYFIKSVFDEAIKHYLSALAPAISSNDDKLLGDLYFNLGRAYAGKKQYAEALSYHTQALGHRSKLADKNDECSSRNSIGLIYWETQDYPNALSYFHSAAALIDSETKPQTAAFIYNNLGNVLVKTGNIAAAGEAYISSLRLKQSHGSPSELAAANLNLGNLFYSTTDYNRALRYFNEALSLYQADGDERNAALVLGNIGAAQNQSGNRALALSSHREALRVSQRLGMQENTAKSLHNIANVLALLGRNDEALSHYRDALKIKEELEDTEGLATTYNNMAKSHYALGRWDDALASLEASDRYASEVNASLVLLDNLRQRAKTLEAKGSYREAVDAYKAYIAMDQEIYEQAKKDVIAEMIARFDTETKEQEITELKADRLLQDEIVKHHRLEKQISIVAALGALLASLCIGLLYRSKGKEIKQRRAVQAELEALNQELEERIRGAIEAYERNQHLIAQKNKLEALGTLAAGLAHEVNQPLSAISMSIENILLSLETGKLNAEYLVMKCNKNMQDIERIRQLINHVRFFSRDSDDHLCEEVDIFLVARSAIELSRHTLKEEEIDLVVELEPNPAIIMGNHYKLEQVLLNLISNARDAIIQKRDESKDEYIGTIRVTGKIHEDRAEIEVWDNGTGIAPEIKDKLFDPFFTTKSFDKGTGLGLSISYGIMAEMGGELIVSSELGTHTSVCMVFGP